MRKPETIFKDWFRTRLDEIPYSYWVKISLPSILGIADLLGCVRGRFVAIELKKDEKSKPSKIQLYNLDRINACGGIGRVAFPENAEVILDEIRQIS